MTATLESNQRRDYSICRVAAVLQMLVLAPHGLLLGILTWLWWPKSNRGWRRFGLVYAYLVGFYPVMHFVFRF